MTSADTSNAAPAPASGPLPQPPARPKDPDWDDYWAFRVAEKAKSRILAYFGAATVVLTLVGLKGLDELRKGIEAKFEGEIARKEKQASDKVARMLADFEKEMEGRRKEVAQRSDEFMKMTMVAPEYRPASAPAAGPALLLDLREAIGEIRNQGSEGTTIGFSVAYALQAAIKSRFNRKVTISARGLFVTARKFDEWPGEDYEGSSVLGGLKGAQTVGAYLESQWPYAGPVPTASVKPAYKVTQFRKLDAKPEALVGAMQAGRVPIVQINVTDDFDRVGADGRVVIRTPLRPTGGHSMAVVGFDQAKAEFRLANMWGAEWGDKGTLVIRDSDLKRILEVAYVIEDVAEAR